MGRWSFREVKSNLFPKVTQPVSGLGRDRHVSNSRACHIYNTLSTILWLVGETGFRMSRYNLTSYSRIFCYTPSPLRIHSPLFPEPGRLTYVASCWGWPTERVTRRWEGMYSSSSLLQSPWDQGDPMSKARAPSDCPSIQRPLEPRSGNCCLPCPSWFP